MPLFSKGLDRFFSKGLDRFFSKGLDKFLPGTREIPYSNDPYSNDPKGYLGTRIMGNPHTTRPWINQASCPGEHVEIKVTGTRTWDPLILGWMSQPLDHVSAQL
jgi:hypothetical protein